MYMTHVIRGSVLSRSFPPSAKFSSQPTDAVSCAPSSSPSPLPIIPAPPAPPRPCQAPECHPPEPSPRRGFSEKPISSSSKTPAPGAVTPAPPAPNPTSGGR